MCQQCASNVPAMCQHVNYWGITGELLGNYWGATGELLGSYWGTTGELLISVCRRSAGDLLGIKK